MISLSIRAKRKCRTIKSGKKRHNPFIVTVKQSIFPRQKQSNRQSVLNYVREPENDNKPRIADEQRFRELIFSIPETVYEMDVRGRLTLFTHIERFGYTQKDLETGFQALQLLIPEDRERCRNNIRKIQNGTDLGFSSYTFQGPDGQTYPVLIHSSPMFKNGEISGIRGLILDDSQRRRLELKLGEQELMFQAVLNAQPHFAVLLRPDGRVIYANKAALERVSLRAEELVGRDLFSILPERIAAERRTVFNKALATKSWVCFEDTREGLLLQNQFYPVLDARGKVTSVALVSVDQTHLQHTEEDLHFNVTKLATLSRLELVGNACSGETLEELLRISLGIISTSCPTKKCCPTAIDLPMASVSTEGDECNAYRNRLAIKVAGKEEGVLRLGCNLPLMKAQKSHCVATDRQFLESIAAILGGLVERFQLSENLRNRTSELTHASRLATIGEMASCFSHELAQPLCAINIFTQSAAGIIKQATDPLPELTEHISNIQNQVVRAMETLSNFKRLSRNSEAFLSALDMAELLKSVLVFANPTLQNAQVKVYANLIPDNAWVKGDRLRLEQVCLNLINNACHSMRFQIERELHIVLKRDVNEFVLTFTDTGHGFDKKVADNLFKPFFTTKPAEEGTGLGLTICQRIIKDHGGKIFAESSPGKGASFRVLLPAMVSRHE